MATCRCGCGDEVRRGRTFVNKEHQLTWMHAGGAREMGALQPVEAKAKGGSIAGRASVTSGRLEEAGRKGAARSREIADQFKRGRSGREADTA